ncbi:MAG: YqeG family HAD IIIA-type phosphatase [Eggerthellaceae bacterium]|nr:YqeG family HAD IIIA-type phosphatase [Eggerthellaceae bacterium]
MALLRPDRYLPRLTCLDVERDIRQAGYTHLLLDVDNTVLPRDADDIPEDVLAWIEGAKAAGLPICLISNDWHDHVTAVAERLGLPLVRGCVKPLPFAFAAARRRIGAPRAKTLVIGDQLVSDVWGARLSGLAVFLVEPLSSADLWHTLALRHIERGILRGIQPEREEHHG